MISRTESKHVLVVVVSDGTYVCVYEYQVLYSYQYLVLYCSFEKYRSRTSRKELQ
jgi:hypothetical protein